MTRPTALARESLRWCLLFALAAVFLDVHPISAQEAKGSRPERAAIGRALQLVPDGAHLSVTVIDPDLSGDPEAVRRLDAFVVRERDGSLRPVVYLNRESAMLRAAAAGSDLSVGVLAAVIRHEAAHLKGAGEAEASAAERRFFEDLLRRGIVPAAEGRAYLHQLAPRVDRP